MAKQFTKEEIEKITQAIIKNSSFDGEVLKLGNLVEVKPVYEHNVLVGYDIYRYADEELMEDEDYDFDTDFITTIYKSEE